MATEHADMVRRIDERIAAAGLSDRAVSLLVTDKPDFIRDLKRKGGDPGSKRMEKLASVLGTSAQWLLYGEGDPEPGPRGKDALNDPFTVFRHNRPKDVPVRGTPSCGEYIVRVDGDDFVVETIEMDLDEVIDFVRRPATLDGRKDVYAIYPQGFSMTPKFEPGDIAYVDGKKPPAIGDYVVVQLKRARGDDADRVVSALLKRLVRQSTDWVELEQFKPEMTFRVERKRIAVMHRIFSLTELAGV